MLIPFSELPSGAYYIVPNEERPALRRKGGPYSGCALVSLGDPVPPHHLHLRPKPDDRIEDSSLMIQRVHVR